jgi:hypothetical protein
MNYSQALEVKDILMQCQGTIPATHVDRIFHYYKSYINPDTVKPCTCSPKSWNVFLIELKNKVEETLTSYETTQNLPQSTN